MGCMEDFIHRIETSEKLYIYGAGLYADIAYACIRLAGLDARLEGFLVSERNNQPMSKEGKPIWVYSEKKDTLKEALVVIAIKEEVAIQIREKIGDMCDCELFTFTNHQAFNEWIYKKCKHFPLQRNKIFVECYEDMGYRCNCKYIAEELLHTQMPVEIVWSKADGLREDIPEEIKVVKTYSYEYFVDFYTSGIRIGNMEPKSYVPKRQEQYYINTWHGTGPFKRVGNGFYKYDEETLRRIENKLNLIDVFISNSGDNTEMFRESLFFRGEVYECGSPRNDIFFQDTTDLKKKIREKLGLQETQKVVLYVPTYRDNREKSFEYYDLDMDVIMSKLEARFGGEFVLLYRFHYFLYQSEKGRDFYPFGKNVTTYSDMQELLLITDVLITDYSSVMWDFSLQDRPVFLYHNDLADYETLDRGFYCPPAEWPYPRGYSSDEICNLIENFDENKYLQDVHAFIEKYKTFDRGDASAKVVERIMDVIHNPSKYQKE